MNVFNSVELAVLKIALKFRLQYLVLAVLQKKTFLSRMPFYCLVRKRSFFMQER